MLRSQYLQTQEKEMQDPSVKQVWPANSPPGPWPSVRRAAVLYGGGFTAKMRLGWMSFVLEYACLSNRGLPQEAVLYAGFESCVRSCGEATVVELLTLSTTRYLLENQLLVCDLC